MELPATIRVKISSEAAESIALTPVVAQDMGLRDLVELILAVTGKDEERLRGLLRRGSIVSGASRFRWQGWEIAPGELAPVLATFPDADPARVFDSAACTRAVLRGTHTRIDLPRDAASEHRMFRKHTFWDTLMDLAAASAPRYAGYSYRERADHYQVDLNASAVQRVHEGAGELRYSALEAQVKRSAFDRMELYVLRPSASAR